MFKQLLNIIDKILTPILYVLVLVTCLHVYLYFNCEFNNLQQNNSSSLFYCMYSDEKDKSCFKVELCKFYINVLSNYEEIFEFISKI